MISACTIGNFIITQWIHQFSWSNHNNGVVCGQSYESFCPIIDWRCPRQFAQQALICWIVVLNSIAGHSCKAPVLTDLWIGLDYGCCIVLELVSLSKTQSSLDHLYKLRMNYRDILCIKLWTENQREQNLPINAKLIKTWKDRAL